MNIGIVLAMAGMDYSKIGCRTFKDPKPGIPHRLDLFGEDVLDIGEYRRVLPHPVKEIGDRTFGAFHLDNHPVGAVLYHTGQCKHPCGPEDKGPEPHPLNDPGKDDAEPFDHDTLCLNSSICAMIQLNQESSPDEVLQDTSNISRSGLLILASLLALAMSKST